MNQEPIPELKIDINNSDIKKLNKWIRINNVIFNNSSDINFDNKKIIAYYNNLTDGINNEPSIYYSNYLSDFLLPGRFDNNNNIRLEKIDILRLKKKY